MCALHQTQQKWFNTTCTLAIPRINQSIYPFDNIRVFSHYIEASIMNYMSIFHAMNQDRTYRRHVFYRTLSS